MYIIKDHDQLCPEKANGIFWKFLALCLDITLANFLVTMCPLPGGNQPTQNYIVLHSTYSPNVPTLRPHAWMRHLHNVNAT